jgi:hypothetical protein
MDALNIAPCSLAPGYLHQAFTTCGVVILTTLCTCVIICSRAQQCSTPVRVKNH